MKKIIFFFLLFSKVVLAQETLKIKYLDSLGNQATKEAFFNYQIFIKEDIESGGKYKLQTFDKNKHMINSYSYSDANAEKLNGESIYYYENGNKKNLITYVDGIPLGKSFKWYNNGTPKEESIYIDANWKSAKHQKIINYWNEKGEKTVSDGNGFLESSDEYLTEKGGYKDGFKYEKWTGHSLKNTFNYEEFYENGELISGVSYESDGTKNEYTSLEIRPEPKKGMKDFYEFIGKKFNYTKEAKKMNIKGRILLSFIVDKDGKIVEPKIINGLGYGLDEEAIRVITSYENWKPALQKGRRVRCSYQIPLSLTGFQ